MAQAEQQSVSRRFSSEALALQKRKGYQWALILAGFTVLYNLIEGFTSVWFGLSDETLALFGFGLDSFETLALRITGTAFYLLIIGIGISAVFNIATHHQPKTTFWGVLISLLSIVTMYILMRSKQYVGHKLDSAPIKADANCTKACLYMSFLLLASSLIYESTGFAYVDSLGALGIMWFAWKEGREAFYKAAHKDSVCASNCH